MEASALRIASENYSEEFDSKPQDRFSACDTTPSADVEDILPPFETILCPLKEINPLGNVLAYVASHVQQWMASNNVSGTPGCLNDVPTSSLASLQDPIKFVADQIMPSHIRLPIPSLHSHHINSTTSYIPLFQNSQVTVGVFVLPPNAVMKLHDHPGMAVTSRLLYGEMTCTSFDAVDKNRNCSPFWAKLVHKSKLVTAPATMTLSPHEQNLHTFTAGASIGCAILDIMIPPYGTGEEDCHYYKVIEEREESGLALLEEISEAEAGGDIH